MRQTKTAITINDIARYARVSKSTVSRVLNKAEGVSDQARTLVTRAMDALDFRPSATARNLARQRSDTIALIVQDIRNPYYAHASWHVERQLRAFGRHLVVFNADNDAQAEKEILETIGCLRVEGLLCVGGNRDATSLVTFHSRSALPMVLIDREVQGYDIPTITLDNRRGGLDAAEYLFSIGHRAILFATSDFTDQEMLRREGFLESMRAHGIEAGHDMVFSQDEEKWAGGSCEGLVGMLRGRDAPTAVFASNDLKAMRVIRVLHQAGIRVPEDVSVIGFDDTPLAPVMVPSLSTMRQPQQAMIRAGMTILAGLVRGQAVSPRRRQFQPELVVRESTQGVQ